MILDLHSHSIKSDDGRARVDLYCQWIKKRAIPLDGPPPRSEPTFRPGATHAA